MAIDHALMDRARRSGEWTLRVYAWSAPVLSLGRNQRAVNVYDHAEISRRGVSVVRRPTGGRALLHRREITYSVTGPAAPDDNLRSAYERINALLLFALDALGVAATIARPDGRSAAPDGQPCFAEPAAGEIVAGGRKLVGSAQWRDAGAILQHGSIIADDDQSLVGDLMVQRPPATPPPATLRDLLGGIPDFQAVAHALFSSVRALADPRAEPLSADEVKALAVDAHIDRYRDPSWTWRR